MKSCFHCKKPLEIDRKVGRGETCPYCHADLHCCLNCVFYDPGAYNECRESQAERVLDKDRGNFCEYFTFSDDQQSSPGREKTTTGQTNPLDKLFKK